jgi:hypothetical protein
VRCIKAATVFRYVGVDLAAIVMSLEALDSHSEMQ